MGRTTFVALLLVAVVGCRFTPAFEEAPGTGGGPPGAAAAPDDDDASPGVAAGHGGSGTAATGGTATAYGGTGALGGSSSRGGSSASAPDDSRAGEAGSGASAGDDGERAERDAASHGAGATPPVVCDAQSVTFDELRAGSVRDDVKVRLDAVATSQKFLVSHTKSGRCLFGAFVGDAPAADGPRGVLVVSYGSDASEEAPCPTGHDAIPDDLAPGDAVTGVGYLSVYAPSTCSGITPSPQLMVDVGCSLSRTGRRMLPAPYDLTFDEATDLARGTSASLVRRFAGGLVRVTGLHTLRADDGEGSVGAYGVVRFAETALELHNELEYGDLTRGGPGDPEKSLSIPYPAALESVTGLVYLDYCTWALTSRSACADLDPPSGGCSS
ncbi:MAG TPA: hypothetical protein VFV94_06220 [Polyangiaceae bacterium]|nr:hypothetical protein [Polyangiaceae bacterium]